MVKTYKTTQVLLNGSAESPSHCIDADLQILKGIQNLKALRRTKINGGNAAVNPKDERCQLLHQKQDGGSMITASSI